MTHKLQQRHPLSAIGQNPLTVQLRYRCTCGQNEVLNIAVVLDKDVTEEHFVHTMQMLYRDMMFEVEQHINPPDAPPYPHPVTPEEVEKAFELKEPA